MNRKLTLVKRRPWLIHVLVYLQFVVTFELPSGVSECLKHRIGIAIANEGRLQVGNVFEKRYLPRLIVTMPCSC